MLLGDIGETALLARYGRLGQARMRLFRPLKFMLASPIQEPAEIRRSIPGAFFVEDKYDGIRAQAHKQGDRVALYSRTLDEISLRFPEVIAQLAGLPGEFILDGELLALRDGRILCRARQRRRPHAAQYRQGLLRPDRRRDRPADRVVQGPYDQRFWPGAPGRAQGRA